MGLGGDFFCGGEEAGSGAVFTAMVCFGAGSGTNFGAGSGIGFGLGDGGKFSSVFFPVNRFFKNTINRFNSVLFPGL